MSTQIARDDYCFRLAARVILYTPSHRQDNTYHGPSKPTSHPFLSKIPVFAFLASEWEQKLNRLLYVPLYSEVLLSVYWSLCFYLWWLYFLHNLLIFVPSLWLDFWYSRHVTPTRMRILVLVYRLPWLEEEEEDEEEKEEEWRKCFI